MDIDIQLVAVGLGIIVALGMYQAAAMNAISREPTDKHNSQVSGARHMKDLMENQSPFAFIESMRMSKTTFKKLNRNLRRFGRLRKGSERTTIFNRPIKIETEEMLAMYIAMLRELTNRTIQDTWQHSGSTVSKYIKAVDEAILRARLVCDDFKARPDPSTPSKIRNNAKFFPFFERAIGALDGTHVPVVVPLHEQARFVNRRKGYTTQNVLGVCDFGARFMYVLSGWEGSAHDSKVFDYALLRGDFPVVIGKYYLGDGGYALSRNVLTPYRRVRYHLKEFGERTNRPMNYKEIFNLRHAMLRNVIERAFGILKKRFPLIANLNSHPGFSLERQVSVLLTATALHNFISLHQRYKDVFEEDYDNDGDSDGEDDSEDRDDTDGDSDSDIDAEDAIDFPPDSGRKQDLVAWRDRIAKHLWKSYKQELRDRE